jgi:hypothetical protein
VWKHGRTVDMSAGGVLIDMAESLPAGCPLEVAMDWPDLYHGKPMVRLFLAGHVVRVDRRGTALRIVHHEFREVQAPIRGFRPPGNVAVAQ